MKHKLIIRKIQLYKLGYVEKPKELEVLDRMKNLTKKGDYYNNYNNDDILFHDKKTNKVFIIYKHIWFIFGSKFNMEYEDIQALTKWYIENQYNLKGITTYTGDLGDQLFNFRR